MQAVLVHGSRSPTKTALRSHNREYLDPLDATYIKFQ